MALSIGIRVGDKIAVDKHTVHVRSITEPNLIVVKVDKGDEQVISDQARTEIIPNVFVFVGVGGNEGHYLEGERSYRLAFEAPRSIIIHRADR